MFFIHLKCLLLLCYSVQADLDLGHFWHITDLHYDMTYFTGKLSCNGPVPQPGKFGDYWCDSPWLLIDNSISAIANIKQDVDFVLWTGDDVAHVKDADLNLETSLGVIANMTKLIKSKLPGTKVYPTFGNHDFWPHDEAQPKPNPTYDFVAELWKDWINNSVEVDRLRKGGFYSLLANPKLRIVAVNSVLWMNGNPLTVNMTDPAGQLAWMNQTLTSSRAAGEKVILTGHVPGGLSTPGLYPQLQSQYYTPYINLLLEFSDIISVAHFGHEHTDGFRLIQSDDGSKGVSQFTAPSVTPWRYRIPTQVGVAHNPAVRLVHYNRKTGANLNFQQYFINLTDTNREGHANWSVLYDFKQAYQVPDMSADSVRKIYNKMAAKESPTTQSYCNFRAVSRYTQTCDVATQARIYCGGVYYDIVKAKKCIDDYMKEGLGVFNKPHCVTCRSNSLEATLIQVFLGILFVTLSAY